MKEKLPFLFNSFTLLIMLILCLPAVTRYPQAAAQGDDLTADSVNCLAFDIYKKLSKNPGNIIYSPVSLSGALALAYGGAAGATRDEFDKVFRIGNNMSSPHVSLGTLFKSLESNSGDEMLSMANSLWLEKTIPFRKKYIRLMADNYGAEPKAVDFKNNTEASRLAINGWVEEKTNRKIQNLIMPGVINPSTTSVLVNAAYFKGAWFNPGDINRTMWAPFWITPAKSRNVETMYLKGYFNVHREKGFQTVFMPYKGGKNMMILIVPEKKDGLAAVEKSMTVKKFNDIVHSKKLDDNHLIIAMPKFKIDNTFDLTNDLRASGLGTALSETGGDYSGMTDAGRIIISMVLQKAFIDVNENGTEAAAATALMERATGMQEEPQLLQVNRPFMYLLCNKQSGVILFMGRVTNPEYK